MTRRAHGVILKVIHRSVHCNKIQIIDSDYQGIVLMALAFPSAMLVIGVISLQANFVFLIKRIILF